MSLMRQFQVRSTPDQMVAGIKWERASGFNGHVPEEFDRAQIHMFTMFVFDDGVWCVNERVGEEDGEILVDGKSLSVEEARRDATMALLGACESALFFHRAHDGWCLMSDLNMVKECDETARIIRGDKE